MTTKATTFRFSETFLERMDKVAKERGMTRTSFVRIAVENELIRWGKFVNEQK